MAIQERNGKIKGRIGNLVYRGYHGQLVVQSAPARVRQTYATRLNALEFGLASTQAKLMRRALGDFIEIHDGRMAVRLNAAVAACMRASDKPVGERNLHDADLSLLRGFEFNLQAPLDRLLRVRPVTDVAANGTIDFRLLPFNPMQDVAYPPSQRRFRPAFTILVTAFDFPGEKLYLIDRETFVCENLDQQTQVAWRCSKRLPAGSFVLVLLAMRYVAENWLNPQQTIPVGSAYYPSVVLDAFHVTAEMVAKGERDQLDMHQPPHTLADLFNRYREKIEKFRLTHLPRN